MADRTVADLAERLARVLDGELGKLEANPPTGDGAARARTARDIAQALRFLRLATEHEDRRKPHAAQRWPGWDRPGEGGSQ